MRTSRPMMLGLLVLLAAVVLWLVARTGMQADDGGSAAPAPSASAPRATSQGAVPSPSRSATAATDKTTGGTAYPSGVDTRDWDDIDACRDGDLPEELAEVADDVEAGGPFDHPGKDGSTFGNREGELPQEERGYYREYTVETPGVDHRGARRIVTGGGQDPEVWYFTDDHYASFCEFAPAG